MKVIKSRGFMTWAFWCYYSWAAFQVLLCGRDKTDSEQVDRVKLAIANPGIYRVTVDELRDAGLI